MQYQRLPSFCPAGILRQPPSCRGAQTRWTRLRAKPVSIDGPCWGASIARIL